MKRRFDPSTVVRVVGTTVVGRVAYGRHGWWYVRLWNMTARQYLGGYEPYRAAELDVANLDPEQLTYKSDSNGYMLYYAGKPIGGAASLSGKPAKHWRHRRADAKMFAQTARLRIDQLIRGGGDRMFLTEISKLTN